MKILNRVVLLAVTAFAAVNRVEATPTKEVSTEPVMVKAVRESLERLSYYGVFDILNYQVDENGTVELSGFAFRDSLKKEAEDAVLKVSGVKQVVNKIEDLEWGVLDDEIRAKVYLTIYRDSFLSRYGTSTDVALANGVGFGPRGRLGAFGGFGLENPYVPGFNPTGDYGIHILVTNGEVILVGNVDSEGDKNLAALKARGVFPVKKVFNELTVKNVRPEIVEPSPLRRKHSIIVDATTF